MMGILRYKNLVWKMVDKFTAFLYLEKYYYMGKLISSLGFTREKALQYDFSSPIFGLSSFVTFCEKTRPLGRVFRNCVEK